MKNAAKLLLSVAFLAMCLSPCTAFAKGYLVILGYVQAKQCWIPISGGDGPPLGEQCITWSVPSVVDIYTDQHKFVAQVTSDSNGFFYVGGLNPGTYVLNVSAIPRVGDRHYFPVVQTVKLHYQKTTSLEFSLRYRHDF
jgi:hypothetical protein